MKNETSPVLFFLLTLVMVFSTSLAAANGRIEINQASVNAAGGFPFTISQPGSYMLTGNLDVPADTDGIIIDTSGVNFDLNGFTISGPATCVPGNCTPGNGEGIRPQTVQDAFGVTLQNGIVRNFASNCIRLRRQAIISHVTVSSCGETGIEAASKSIVTYNTITRTGTSGLALLGGSNYAHNNISESGLAGGGEPSISGNSKATAGNICDDGSCGWVDNRRSFYLTQTTFMGIDALGACSDGYHMASMWEMTDISSLRYDSALGINKDDSGTGPPAVVQGWVRTGNESNREVTPGQGNCFNWTSNAPIAAGTWIWLYEDWAESASLASPWQAGFEICDIEKSVWCIED